MSEADAPFAVTPAPAPPAPPSLEERERTILNELAREVDAWVTFQGLRRQLGVHQQALARVLRRLEQQGLVAHEGKGYQLTDAGMSALSGVSTRPTARPVVPVLTALLPPYVQPGDVAAQLSRRWFGGLRWYGQSEGPGETSLHWMADKARVTAAAEGEDADARSLLQTRVTLRVSPGSVTLEVEDSADAPGRAFAAARPVLAALAELYGSSAA